MACQLTFLERERVSQMHDAGASNAEIAAELGRARSTVGRELLRNSVAGEYSAIAAQGLTQQRRRERPLVRKMDRPEVNDFVRSRLVRCWSPDQIAGRSKSDFAGDPGAGFRIKRSTPGSSLNRRMIADILPASCVGLDAALPARITADGSPTRSRSRAGPRSSTSGGATAIGKGIPWSGRGNQEPW
jgi:hypothetical protein